MKNQTSFIVGGLGLLGLQTAHAFAEAGSNVVVIDNNKIVVYVSHIKHQNNTPHNDDDDLDKQRLL